MSSTINATWTQVASSARLQRSSQCLSVVGAQAIIFGGELKPREPIDNNVDLIEIQGGGTVGHATTLESADEAPSPRVGSASAMLGSQMYLFSGRGGIAMAPVDEKGGLWRYAPQDSRWTFVTPSDPSAPSPAARSYHAMTSDDQNLLYIHAGCPENGRLSDLWSFNVQERSWTELAPAPDPPRGGTSIAFSAGKVYRMNGFDGTHEQGSAIDIYSPTQNTWSTFRFVADGVAGPSPRSVSALLPVTWDGRKLLITLCGEQDPSALGHAGAGKMRDDVWAWNVDSEKWEEVEIASKVKPAPRGWFAADVLQQDEQNTIVIHGGLAEDNSRLGDVWLLQPLD